MAAGSDIFNRIQKIILLGLIIAAFPLVAFYMIMPRLAIVPGVGNAQFNFIDISVANFTGEPGVPFDLDNEETATLDFWIEVGLPLKEAASDAFERGTGPDLRYYNADGTVNKNNLVDETMQLVVPMIKITAKYKNSILGTGGSFRQYILNAEHPVEYVHLYLTGSRMQTGGLMYMFTSMASNKVLFNVLLDALGGPTGGDDPFQAILGDLKLELTAYLGSSPLTLPLDMSAFMSPFPCIDVSSGGTINPSAFEMPGDPKIYYNHSVNNDTVARFMAQLGVSDPANLPNVLGPALGLDDPETAGAKLEAMVINLNLTVDPNNLALLFEYLAQEGYDLVDFFYALDTDVPTVLSKLLFRAGLPLYGMETQVSSASDWTAIAPEMAGIASGDLLLVVVIGSFVVAFLLFAMMKGSVKINRSDFLGRENVARNVKDFISRVDQLGGKVSVQNAESLAIRAFRTEGKIDKPADVEKRAKTYVENQKLLVTLQSRASRAYVAQKFKDCIGAIEKMIQIARKLEDQTLVQNYEENLAKVVRLLRRKGISVSTKVRVEEGAKPGDEVEQLSIYKKELIDLQNRASKAFAEKNFSEAKESIKQMLAIAKKIQDPVLIRNYEANLRKIITMEKGGSV